MILGFSSDLLTPDIPVLEKIIRPLIVYVILVVAFRFLGKRFLGSRTPFDFIILLVIANVLQNAMIGADNSLVGGLIGAATLFGADLLADELRFRYPWFKHLVEGEPTLLVRDGKPIKKNLDRERLTRDDLRRGLARENISMETQLSQLKRVVLESDGTFTVTWQDDGSSAAFGEAPSI